MSLVHLQFDKLLLALRHEFGRNDVDAVHGILRLKKIRLIQSGLHQYMDCFAKYMRERNNPQYSDLKLLLVLTDFIQNLPTKPAKRPVINNHFHFGDMDVAKLTTVLNTVTTAVPEPDASSVNETVVPASRRERMAPIQPNIAKPSTMQRTANTTRTKQKVPFPFCCRIVGCSICSDYFAQLKKCTKSGCTRSHIEGGKHYLSHRSKRKLYRQHQYPQLTADALPSTEPDKMQQTAAYIASVTQTDCVEVPATPVPRYTESYIEGLFDAGSASGSNASHKSKRSHRSLSPPGMNSSGGQKSPSAGMSVASKRSRV